MIPSCKKDETYMTCANLNNKLMGLRKKSSTNFIPPKFEINQLMFVTLQHEKKPIAPKKPCPLMFCHV
jgi:hypothetical protein